MDHITEFRNGLSLLRNDFQGLEAKARGYETQLTEARTKIGQLEGHLTSLRKARLGGGGGGSCSANAARGLFVSEECARYMAAIVILGAEAKGKLSHIGATDRDALVRSSVEMVGMETRAALTTSDIPLPANYGREVVELIWMYGQARKFCTVYPLGSGTVKLPKLKTSPAFGFIDASAPIGEKVPQIEFKTFAAEKGGGLIRIPSELNNDSVVGLGQFIVRYIARETANLEDRTCYIGDGSGTYKTFKGIGKAAVDLGKVLDLAATKTKPSDVTLASLRELRTLVDPAALNTSAYQMNMSMENLLASFNTGSDRPYVANGPNGPTLDGFPIHWIGVMPIYETVARVSQVQVTFGDEKFQYLGIRDGLRIEQSNDVYFANDEIAIRALERLSVQLMADGAVAALRLAAA